VREQLSARTLDPPAVALRRAAGGVCPATGEGRVDGGDQDALVEGFAEEPIGLGPVQPRERLIVGIGGEEDEGRGAAPLADLRCGDEPVDAPA
jgi:hypothetical protein